MLGINNIPSILSTLRQIVGTNNVLTEGDLTAYEQDWRKRQRGKALAVVRPASTLEVAEVVKLCAAENISIVPQGGNTGMVAGSTPDASGTQIVLSLQRMNRIRKLDANNLTITLEAGCILQSVLENCEQNGFLFPLRMASQGSCTIGGNLGTNAGGTQVVRFGNTRELCLGLEVVTAQGDIWDGLTGLRKDNTGYDLRHLMIGSEGTLGIITAAVMKIFPQPAAQLTAFAAVPSMEAAVQLLGLAHQHLGAGLTGFEVMGRLALGLVEKHFPQVRFPFPVEQYPYCVVLENSDQESPDHARERLESLLEAALESGCVVDAVAAESIAQARELWKIRESIPLAQAQEGANVKHDISIPISQIPAFVAETDALLAQAFPAMRVINYGHLGDGNLHYNVQTAMENESAIHTLVYAQVARFKGSISAEHGIGSAKREELAHYKSPAALGMMHALKRALDPLNILNPNRILLIPSLY
jgi:FAD/FMN-containing dehydrogenase